MLLESGGRRPTDYKDSLWPLGEKGHLIPYWGEVIHGHVPH
jgi:hypothetical protein